MKRLFTTLALLVAVLCASVQTYAYDCVIDGIFYNLDKTNATATVTNSINKYKGEITIPESITYNGSTYSVTTIGFEAFFSCKELTSVTLPNSLTTISNNAFNACSALTSMTIPDKVTSIGIGAFYVCSGLTSLTIGNSVATIDEAAFAGCTGLKSVTIPASVTKLGNSVFSTCTGLTRMVVDSGNTVYDSRGGCNAIIETASNTLIFGCKNTAMHSSVTAIGNSAFFGCSELPMVIIPPAVTSIGKSAFERCTGMTEIYCLASNPPTCGNRAFDGVDRTKCTLYVLEESLNLYVAASPWNEFRDIKELAGVDDITVDGDDAETLYDVYNVQGMKVGSGLRRADMTDALPHGIYILVSPNATQKIRL